VGNFFIESENNSLIVEAERRNKQSIDKCKSPAAFFFWRFFVRFFRMIFLGFFTFLGFFFDFSSFFKKD